MSVLLSRLPADRNTILFLTAFCFFLSIPSVQAASLSADPTTATHTTGDIFTTTITLDPEGDTVGAVSATLQFDPTVLSVVGVQRSESAPLQWTTSPTFSNQAGTISFSSQSEQSITAPVVLLVISFYATKEGESGLTSTDAIATTGADSSVNIITDTPEATYIVRSENGIVSESNTDQDFRTAPTVQSNSYSNPNRWYAYTDGRVFWELPEGVTAVAAEVATSAAHVPLEVFDPPIESFSLSGEGLTDGIFYLSVQFKGESAWGEVTNYPIHIDTTPPEPFSVSVTTDREDPAATLLHFETTDSLSGIDHYTILRDGQVFATITPAEAAAGYRIPEFTARDTNTITVRAYDQAGNVRTADTPVVLLGRQAPSTATTADPFSLVTPVNLLLLALLLIVAAQYMHIRYETARSARAEARLQREITELQTQSEKIFTALRNEIYDQIKQITKRKRLSKGEREAVEGLNQALEVSETLLEKEITDVKKSAT